ncbi:MAG: aspartate-semialdehyde dehydrogenase [Thaumarchaeota archaeon]|nr:aspartate-semialdehyde dehydrogenase [Nitrososphaerota archaeon]
MMKKKVAIIGVTGSVGQEFVVSLDNHPWFDVVQIAASKKSAGKNYIDSIKDPNSHIIDWHPSSPISDYIKTMKVEEVEDLDVHNLDLVFSSIESNAAREIESKFAKHIPVISTSSAYRYEEDVPILIPGINDAHVDLIDTQKKNRNWNGFVAPIPNCTTTGLAITLKPLYEKFGTNKVIMTSMQAISGAGRTPGVSAMDITDNIIPYIPNEEKKVRVETTKILGKLTDGKIKNADIKISCTCTRVPVIDGHTESVSIETLKPIDPTSVKESYKKYFHDLDILNLPSSPPNYYEIHDEPTRPQPRIDREINDGMTTSIGRLEKESIFDNGIKYVLFSHNKKMGSAKGAILLAELLYQKGKI